MNIWCFLQTRFSSTLFNKTLGWVLVLKHTTEPFKHSAVTLGRAFEALRENQKVWKFEKLGQFFKNSATSLCYNTAHAVPSCPTVVDYSIFPDTWEIWTFNQVGLF